MEVCRINPGLAPFLKGCTRAPILSPQPQGSLGSLVGVLGTWVWVARQAAWRLASRTLRPQPVQVCGSG